MADAAQENGAAELTSDIEHSKGKYPSISSLAKCAHTRWLLSKLTCVGTAENYVLATHDSGDSDGCTKTAIKSE